MTTELEKTQLEIARLQLEQERHKLAGLQMRQKVVNNLAQGAVAVGGAVGKGGSTLLRYVGRWLTWALVVETCIVVLLGAATLLALCHFEWNLTSTLVPSNTEIKWSGRGKGVGGQVLELGHAQVGNGDEVAHRPEAPCCRLGLLQQAVHGFHVGI